MDGSSGWKERIMDIGEKRVTEWVNQILAAKTCEGHKGLRREGSVELRKQVEEMLGSLLSLLDIPTRRDLDDISHRIEILNGKVVSLTLKMEKLLEQRQKVSHKKGGASTAE